MASKFSCERYGFEFCRSMNFFFGFFSEILKSISLFDIICMLDKISSITNYDHFISFTFIYHIPSSLVLFTSTGLFGPSPSEVYARTWNSYSVNLSSPVTFLLNINPLLMVKVVSDQPKPFFWKNSLNPVMFLPCLAGTGGNCQEAIMLVGELAVNLKAVGGCDGTEINNMSYLF